MSSGNRLLPGPVGVAACFGFTFYLINYLFSALGPATVIGGTIIVPEILPIKIRASGQGINISIDRLANALVITAFTTLIGFLALDTSY